MVPAICYKADWLVRIAGRTTYRCWYAIIPGLIVLASLLFLSLWMTFQVPYGF